MQQEALLDEPLLRQVLTPKTQNRFLGCTIDPLIPPSRPATKDQDAIVPGMVFMSAEGAQNEVYALWATVNGSRQMSQGMWVPGLTPHRTQYLMAFPRKRFACRLSSNLQLNMVTADPAIIYQISPDGITAKTKEERLALILAGEAEFVEQVFDSVRALCPIGIHPSWAQIIYEDIQKLPYVPPAQADEFPAPWAYRPLICHGSALRVWRLNATFDWIEFVRQRVRSGRLPWPD